ncbi:MAG: hypothetical protein HYW23_02670 [Candidatus Aenigmarchaeota archaeon]|nr:hypothetical protein [Candidatus Aenigmarchaeota archaeon]
MYTKEQYERAFELRKEGFTYKEISKKLNVAYPGTIIDWVKRGKIPKGHFLKSNFNKLSSELGYIRGVLMGDGYVSIKAKGTKGQIGLEVKDKDFAQTFHNQLEKWSGLKAQFDFNENKGLYTVQLYSLRAAEFLKEFDISDLVNANEEIKVNFLRGMFDSEGNVSGSNLNTPRTSTRFVALFNTDEELIRLVKVLLEAVGIKVQNIDKKIGGFTGHTVCFRLRIGSKINLEMFKNKIGFSIARKNKKLEDILSSYGHNPKSIYYNISPKTVY